MAQISNILGIDFGKSKIGLAIADSETKMAFALETIANNRSFLKRLREIVEKKNVQTIVIGITAHEKDRESFLEKEDFVEEINKELAVKVVLHEEMFTTKMAHDNLKEHGKKGFSKNDDQESARIILQSWLDKNEMFEKSVEALKHTRNS